jgi:serine/threonine protein kinase
MLLPASLATRYQTERPLGAGGMGAVSLAWDQELERRVAVKLALRPDHPGIVERFRREARAMAAIEHPHVARLLDYGEADDQLYMVQEFIPGTTPAKGTLEDPVAAMLDVAGALEAVHQEGVLHRDIKPMNLIQREDGTLVVIDFGLARREGEEKVTETGAVVGTPYFLSPEALRGEKPTAACDFYAWGVTLFRLLEGHYPLSMERIVAWATCGEGEIQWEETPEDAPGRRMVEACMAFLPEERPVTRAALEVLGSGPPPPAPPVPESRAVSQSAVLPPVEAPPARRGAFWPAAFAGLCLVSALVWSLGPSGVLRPAPPPPAAPVEALPEAEALERVARDLRRHFAWDTPGTERDPSWVRAVDAEAALAPLSDVRLPIKLGRAGETASRWVNAVGPGGWEVPGRAERLRSLVVGDILQAIALHRASRNLQDHKALEALQSGSLDPTDQMLDSSIPELRDRTTEVLAALAETDAGEATLVFEAFVAGVAHQLLRKDLPDQLVTALEAQPPSPLRASLGIALDFLTLHVVSGGELPCEPRTRATDFRHRFYRAAPAGFSLRERWRRRLRGMTFEVQLDRVCDPPNSKRRESQLGAYLDEVVARGVQVPDLVGVALLDLEEAAQRKHVTFDDASPWVLRALPRVARLRGRFLVPGTPGS